MKSSSSNIYSDENNNVYYNVNINGGTDYTKANIARFSETRTSPILKNANAYQMSVVRFTLPMQLCPKVIPPLKLAPNTNPDTLVWSVTIRYNNINYTQNVTWVPIFQNINVNSRIAIPPIPPYTSQEAIRRQYNGLSALYYFCYSYQYILNLINEAYDTVYGLFIAANPGLVTITHPPFFSYDPTTKLFNLTVQEGYLINNVDIACNNSLYQDMFFNSFDAINRNINDPDYNVSFVIQDLQYNYIELPIGNCYRMIQDYGTVEMLNPVTNIRFQTSTLPLQLELTPTIPNSNNNNNQFPILTDFEMQNDDNQNYIHYLPTAQYRYMSLVLGNSNDLNQFDISIFLIDQYNIQYPLYIPANKTATIKILFQPK